jgi:Fic family protein
MKFLSVGGVRDPNRNQKKDLLRNVVSYVLVGSKSSLSAATVNKALKTLTELGIVREITGRLRNRLFANSQVLHVLSEGTEK